MTFFFVFTLFGTGQQVKPDSSRRKQDSIHLYLQLADSSKISSNTNKIIPGDSLLKASSPALDSVKEKVLPARNYQAALNNLLKKKQLINIELKPVASGTSKDHRRGKEYLFYLLSGIILLFGFFKVFYANYFDNIFRLFFNTSLRQNQLTDLLLQARLPSLIFNLFFIVSAGLYLWLLLHYFNFINEENNKKTLIFCVLSIGLIYVGKFCVLKFIGWATGMAEALNTYIFIIFLVNKIAGVVLIPFIVVLAFAQTWRYDVVILSFLVIGVLFLLRFIRSYNLLQNQLRLSKWHFLLYMVSLEVLPILVIYKAFFKILF
jgi:hypothetical protein